MEFPDDLPELGVDIVDGDFILLNKKKALASRLWTYVSDKIDAASATGVQVISSGGSHTIADDTELVVLTGLSSVTLTAPTPSEGRRFTVKNAAESGGKTIAVLPATESDQVERGDELTSYAEGSVVTSWTWHWDGTDTWRIVASDDDRVALRIRAREIATEASYIREAGEESSLEIGTVNNGQVLLRDGTNIVGASKSRGALGSLEGSHLSGWRDITSEITVRTTGGSAPAYTAFRNGIYAYEFPHTANREFFMTFHLQHDWKRGTPIFLHVHFAPGNSALTGVVRWGVEYTIAAGHQQGASSVFGATQTVYADISVGANSEYEHHIAELSTGISDAKLEVDALVLVRFFRDTSVAGNFGASVWAFTADVHYEWDRYGTANRAPNFYGSYT